jgi:hypothetical protein
MWTPEEDELLRAAVERHGDDWNAIADDVPGRNKLQCVQRWKKTLRPGLTKGPWKPEEDALLIQAIREIPEGDWQAVSKRIPGRNAKQCKERWMLNLNPSINHGPWTAEEDAMLIELHAEVGGKWSLIAKRLHGRTEHAIKTRFLSLQKKAARVRSWTVDEDRIVLKQYMFAQNLDGVAATMKALPGRTKRQVQERWQYLRDTYISIDDLATSRAQGGISLTDQDLKNLIPSPSFINSSNFFDHNNNSSSHSGMGNAPPVSMASSEFSSSSSLGDQRIKSLARRPASSSTTNNNGTSNPGSADKFKHQRKRLEKSGSSSGSQPNRTTRDVGMLGSEIFHQAFVSGGLSFSSSSQMQLEGMSSPPFSSQQQSFQHFSSHPNSAIVHVEGITQDGATTTSAASGTPIDDPFVLGLLDAGLHAPSIFPGATGAYAKRPSQAPKTMSHHLPASSSLILPPLSPQPFPTNGTESGRKHVNRKESFHRFAPENEAYVSGNGTSPVTFRKTYSSFLNPGLTGGHDTDQEMFRAFQGMAPELSGSAQQLSSSFVEINPPHYAGRYVGLDTSTDYVPAPLISQDSLLGLEEILKDGHNSSAGVNSRSLRKFGSSSFHHNAEADNLGDIY